MLDLRRKHIRRNSSLFRLIHAVDFVLALFELEERLLLLSRTGLGNGETPV
jgi:hypothetical protein